MPAKHGALLLSQRGSTVLDESLYNLPAAVAGCTVVQPHLPGCMHPQRMRTRQP